MCSVVRSYPIHPRFLVEMLPKPLSEGPLSHFTSELRVHLWQDVPVTWQQFLGVRCSVTQFLNKILQLLLVSHPTARFFHGDMALLPGSNGFIKHFLDSHF